MDNPVSLYAATKKSNELLAHSYSKLYDIPSTGLRFFTVYCPAGRPDMFYFSATRRLVEGGTIRICVQQVLATTLPAYSDRNSTCLRPAAHGAPTTRARRADH